MERINGNAQVAAANARTAHMKEIAGRGGFPAVEKESRALMEGYWGRVSEEQRVPSLRLAWQELWAKMTLYLPKEDAKKVGEAFVFSSVAHAHQRRHSGEPYVIHTVSVAAILAGMKFDRDVLIAALMHDVLEDTEVTPEQLEEKFGSDVHALVDGLTKLGKLQFSSEEEYQSENLRKMFSHMAKDIRVVFIKLADRLHNMRTISSHRHEKQEKISRETLDIYAPLAHRLGMYQIKRELEDLSFCILDPETYYDIKRRVRKKLPRREEVIKKAMDILNQKIAEENIAASIKGRSKHIYSIYCKMRRKNLSFDQLYDILALRVIVKTIGECYQVLGIVHTLWSPIPGLFDDYIANPKRNQYQSLHTTVIGPEGDPLEVQIRTEEMNLLAEYGIAAHWNYKEGGRKVDEMDKRLNFIRMALDSVQPPASAGDAPHKESSGADSERTLFLDNLKTDVLTEEVFVYTPKGRIVRIPKGSTSIDFAYAVHTQVGHTCVGTVINGRIAPLDQELKDGNIVKILTSPQGKPSRDWLKIAKSSRARNKIRSWFRQQESQGRDEKLKHGRELLEREAARRYPNVENPLSSFTSQLTHIARELGYGGLDDLTVAVGAGVHSTAAVFGRLPADASKAQAPVPDAASAQPRKEVDSEVVVDGVQGVLVTLAQCCRPIPGDEIGGFVTQSRGISVHRKDCRNYKKSDESRRVDVFWGKPKATRYIARVNVEGVEKPSLLADIVQTTAQMDGLVSRVIHNTSSRVVADFQVKDLEHLYRIMGKLNNIPGVLEVNRE